MINRSNTLRDQAYTLIRNMIIKQDITFGSKISVADLSREFGISNSPIREAISLLEMDGLVVNVPNYGFHVINFDQKSFFEVSQMIEVILIGCYIKCVEINRTDALIELLKDRLDFQEKSFCREPSFAYACTAIEFDRAFVDVLENEMLTKMFDGKFNLLIMDTLYAYEADPSSVDDNLSEHIEILNAVIEGNHAEVVNSIMKHYDKSKVDLSIIEKLTN